MKKTLKTILLLAMMLVILIALTGCANINYEVQINKDGSGKVAYVMGYDKNFLASMGIATNTLAEDDTLKEMMQDAADEGYTVENYEDNTTFGFKASKEVANIQTEFSINNTIGGEEESQTNDSIIYEKNLLKTRFYQNVNIDLTFDNDNSQESAMAQTMLKQMNVSYKVVVPFKVGTNNATTVSEDGKTLEWKLEAGKVNEVKFEAAEDYTIVALIGGLVILGIILAIAIMVVNKKKASKEVLVKENKENTVKPEKEEEVLVEEVKQPENMEEPKIEETTTEEIQAEKEEVVEEVSQTEEKEDQEKIDSIEEIQDVEKEEKTEE